MKCFLKVLYMISDYSLVMGTWFKWSSITLHGRKIVRQVVMDWRSFFLMQPLPLNLVVMGELWGMLSEIMVLQALLAVGLVSA